VSISNLIAAVNERLTRTERRIAEAILADPTLLAFGRVSDLAKHVGTSRPSVVRFATKLGFSGYTDLQEQVRAGMSQQLSRPTERIRQEGTLLAPARSALEKTIAGIFETLSDERLKNIATQIVGAENVWIISGETSRAGAHALQSGLTIIRPDVHFIQQHSVARDLSSATTEDIAIVIDFARYRRHSITAARTLADQGVPIIAITDGPFSPLASLTENRCDVSIPAIGPFDSSVPAVTVAELIVAQVAMQLRDEARKRIDRTEALWETTETFYND
jgi:DNA-binding MurR/RpiR family transcriptional regulator